MSNTSPTSPSEPVEISVVIPAYNEMKRLPPSLEVIEPYLREHYATWEILVSDDGSTDGSIEYMEPKFPNVKFHRVGSNRGKGAAVREGMMRARGKLVLFTDADLSTPIWELGKLDKELKGGDFDIVIASRDLPESQLEVPQPWYREISGRTFNLMVRALSRLPFHDTQCGFKLFTREAVHSVFPLARNDLFAFDVELLMIARMLQLRMKEVPVKWIDTEGSKVHFFTDGPRMIFDILQFQFWHLTGSYRRARRDLDDASK